VTTTKTRYASALPVLIAALLAISGCGSDSGGSGYGGNNSGTETAAETAPTPADAASGAAVLTVATAPGVGAVLVDSDGFTVYDFHKDKGTVSSCYGACAGVWPPLTTEGAPQAKAGASTSMLGTTKRKDGTV